MSPLPPLSSCTEQAALDTTLSILFEPSEALHNLLVPAVLAHLAGKPPTTYAELIDTCATVTDGWTWGQKADFLSGHPVIGEVKQLSALSAGEQGGATPKIVLERLAHLNALYAHIFPGLRFITFVNGRSRAAIIPQFEATCGLPVSPVPLPADYPVTQPAIEDVGVVDPESDVWKAECHRGLKAVWDIAVARVNGMGLD